MLQKEKTNLFHSEKELKSATSLPGSGNTILQKSLLQKVEFLIIQIREPVNGCVRKYYRVKTRSLLHYNSPPSLGSH